MVFNSFRIKIFVRLILISCLITISVYYIQQPYYYFTAGEFLFLTLMAVFEFIWFIEKGYKQVNKLLESLHEQNFNVSFNSTENNKIFRRQAELLSKLIQLYKNISIKNEYHYRFLNHLVDHINYGIICFDNNGNVNLANKMMKDFCGKDEIKHFSALKIIDLNIFDEAVKIRTGENRLIQIIKNGEVLKFSMSCKELKLLDKKSKLITLNNIQSTLQENELDSNKKLMRILTHEIMNSVTPILSLSEAINENLSNADGTKKELGELKKQDANDMILGYEAIEIRSRALMRFVNDFRTLSRLPAPVFEDIKTEELINNLISIFKPEFEKNLIQFHFILPPESVSIRIDRTMIEQVIINLLKNAIEALIAAKMPKIQIEVKKDDEFVTILITDNGIGILPENLDKIFVPFFTTKKNGSGIGLSISQQIMFLHNGMISVKSIPSIKTTFTLKFIC